jgi:hypothetical protein
MRILGVDTLPIQSCLCVYAKECATDDSCGHASAGDEVIVMLFCILSVAPLRLHPIVHSSSI